MDPHLLDPGSSLPGFHLQVQGIAHPVLSWLILELKGLLSVGFGFVSPLS